MVVIVNAVGGQAESEEDPGMFPPENDEEDEVSNIWDDSAHQK